MILAAAQTKPTRGDIKENLLDHYRLIELAADHGANLIVFPELSITGYERETAESLSFTIDDSRLDGKAVDNDFEKVYPLFEQLWPNKKLLDLKNGLFCFHISCK